MWFFPIYALRDCELEKPGKENTQETLRLVEFRVDQLSIRNIVAVSCTDVLARVHRKIMEDNGAKVFYHLHAIGGLSRAVKNNFARAVSYYTYMGLGSLPNNRGTVGKARRTHTVKMAESIARGA